MPAIYTNNAASRLVANVEIGATTVELVDGSPFPAPGGGEWFWLTFERAGGLREIVKVTVRSGGTCTIDRAQQGTTERAWPRASTIAEHRWTASDADEATQPGGGGSSSYFPSGW